MLENILATHVLDVETKVINNSVKFDVIGCYSVNSKWFL